MSYFYRHIIFWHVSGWFTIIEIWYVKTYDGYNVNETNPIENRWDDTYNTYEYMFYRLSRADAEHVCLICICIVSVYLPLNL